MKITVYLGSSFGNDPVFTEEIKKLGEWIGKNGHTLVYGGSKKGLMGTLAETVLLSGGEAIGVEPQFFLDMGYVYDDLTKLYATKTMSERKAKMIELGEAFIAFPGGLGTLEEIAEVMCKKSLFGTPEHMEQPCIVYNLNGYYDGLKQLMQTMLDTELSTHKKQSQIHFANNLEEIISILEAKK